MGKAHCLADEFPLVVFHQGAVSLVDALAVERASVHRRDEKLLDGNVNINVHVAQLTVERHVGDR